MENYVKSVHATSLTYKQTVPKVPAANTFVIRLQNESRETETDASYRIDREYQIVYFGVDAQDVLAKMDTLGAAFYETEQIPVDASTRFIRVEAFSFSAPFKTENDLYASIGVIQTETRANRTQKVAPLIGEVNASITVIL